jgi:predicted PurR-regulated permease PerM
VPGLKSADNTIKRTKFILEETKINNERFNRKQLQTLELITATAVLLYVCYLLALPFLPALAWALALAVVALPIHRRIERLVKNTNLAAGLSVFLVAVVVVAPIAFVVRQITSEAVRSTQTV